MPLLPGKQNIGRNIRELEASGRPHKVAVAAALHTANPSGGKALEGTTSTGGYQDVPASGGLRLPKMRRRALLKPPELQIP